MVTVSCGVSTRTPSKRPRRQWLGREGGAGGQVDGLDPLEPDLVHGQGERIALDQVPGVAGELAADVGDDAGRTEHVEVELAGEKDAQQVVEADEVIHVRVRHEHMADLEQRGGRLAIDAAEVEQHGAPLMAEGDVQAGIAERRVEQAGSEGDGHGGSQVGSGARVTRIRRAG